MSQAVRKLMYASNQLQSSCPVFLRKSSLNVFASRLDVLECFVDPLSCLPKFTSVVGHKLTGERVVEEE
jgi:hypothetical protein